MKLIDLLVQELPKRGGWPKDAEYCHLTQYDRHCLTIVFSHWQTCTGNNLTTSKEEMIFSGIGYLGDTLYGCIVTAKEYKSALALLQKPAWNGEGLPPVGCECEVSVDGGRSWCTYRAINEKNGFRLIEIGNLTEEFQNNNWIFRPLRTEAERKHEAVLESICAVLEMVAQDYKREDEAKIIYEAIAAGKIRGVKLED